jgi:hypothetical protein
MNTTHKIPGRQIALKYAVCAALAVVITLLTTQAIVASATAPQYPVLVALAR